MALNAEQTFSLDLSIFGGKMSDMAAANAPAGVSVSCSDMFFSAQYTATRPALIHAFTRPAAIPGITGYDQSTGGNSPTHFGPTNNTPTAGPVTPNQTGEFAFFECVTSAGAGINSVSGGYQ